MHTEQSLPVPTLAVASLVCGVVGCLAAVAAPAVVYATGLAQETTGVSAGIAAGLVALVSGTLSLLAIVLGIAALRRIRGGQCRGRGRAWTGIMLGCLPFAVLLATTAPALIAVLEIWMFGVQPKQ
jgi:hypothetical protein